MYSRLSWAGTSWLEISTVNNPDAYPGLADLAKGGQKQQLGALGASG